MRERERERAVRTGLGMLLPRLWRFAVVLTRDRAAADDLVQATCLRALDRAQQFDPATRLDRWTFAILASIWRNEARRKLIFARIVEGGLPGMLPEDEGASAEEALFARRVVALVDRLPEAQRAAVALVYLEDFTYREAAQALDIPVGTVTSRLAAARGTLLRMIEDGATARAAAPNSAGDRA
jgi:RNA polymerase sigma-70 factor (ECF subfamily)